MEDAEAADREESEKNLLLRFALTTQILRYFQKIWHTCHLDYCIYSTMNHRAGVYSCLGDAWVSCPAEAQPTYLVELLGTLRLRAESTTKRNQVGNQLKLTGFRLFYSLYYV